MKEIPIPLSSLEQGQGAKVSHLQAVDGMRRRLQDIGLIDGTYVECIQKSPAGDPTAYFIRGAVIALRARDAINIYVCRGNILD